MATICTKCGTTLASDAGFCTNCGAPIGATAPPPDAAAAPPMQAPPPPPSYAQPATAYPVPPPKSGSSALKIILIVVAVVVGLGIISVGIFGYIGYKALHSAGNSLSLGSSADVSDADLGVSVYPGAARSTTGSMRLKAANNLVISALFTTSDPASSVVTYYQGQLGSLPGANVNVRQSGDATTLTSASINDTVKESIVVTVTPHPSISQTQIMILHTKAGSSSQ